MSARLVIDLNALAANYAVFVAAAGAANCAAVVKADAYGLGAERISRRLWAEGCRTFFVATAGEGVALRAVLPRARIFVLDGVNGETVHVLQGAGLAPVLNDLTEIGLWQSAAPGAPAAVHVDTGMQRRGFDTTLNPSQCRGLALVLLMTHLARADEPGHPFTALQLERFATVATRFPGVPVSLCNSAGTLSCPDAVGDLVRPGIGLYGGNPFYGSTREEASGGALRPVVTLEAEVLQVRSVPAGSPVGYGGTYSTGTATRLATLGIGYADGLLRSLSNRGVVVWRGARLPMVGRISMDLTVVDVGALGVNLLLLVAVLSMLQATLTLPGMAAMALALGMAIDSNVLINERVR
ncbi:MAG: alanine racemase, partial [Pseudomonadales bacterium]